MTTLEELEDRIIKLENNIRCNDLENKIKILENEVNHIKAVLQYQLRKNNK